MRRLAQAATPPTSAPAFVLDKDPLAGAPGGMRNG
jgi:hypothetical protein